MCIQSKFLAKDRKQWLKKQPETITAYKLVEVKHEYDIPGKRLFPFFVSRCIPFKRTNSIREVKKTGRAGTLTRRAGTHFYSNDGNFCYYIAYYHLFANREDLVSFISESQYEDQATIVECQVPKEFITDIGMQWNRETIVTRQFTIVGQDEYLN